MKNHWNDGRQHEPVDARSPRYIIEIESPDLPDTPGEFFWLIPTHGIAVTGIVAAEPKTVE
jgi:hypothetical protein